MQWDVLAHGYGLVEGPTIDTDGSLLFSDVLNGGVYRLAADGAITTVVPKRRGIGGIALHADGGIVCSGRDVVHIHDGETRTVLHVDDVAGWNDLCTDASGRVYAGALRFAVFDPNAVVIPGECWSVDSDTGPAILFDGVVHANGVVCLPDGRVVMSDTRSRELVFFDSTTQTRRAVDMREHGHPDGMALDEDGNVWVALVSGGVGRFAPDGHLLDRIEPPSSFVTSLCFSGNDLYVTTGGHDDPALAGCVLRTTLGVAGAPVPPARV
jgi:gluconolactonase